MPKINIEKILVWIIKTGLYGSLILPFIVTKSALYPYVFGKALFFQILIEVLLAFWIALIWFWPKYRPTFCQKTYSQSSKIGIWKLLQNPCHGQSKKTLLNWLIIAFFGALILSTIFSADPVRSFWGTQERMTGVFTLLHFGIFYFMLIAVMRTRRDWLWFLRGLVLAGLIVSSYLAYQGFLKSVYRPAIWFGNPGIAGSFLLFFIFLTPIWWIFERRKKAMTLLLDKLTRSYIIIIFILIELIIFSAIGINATRAVWVGLSAAAMIGILSLPFWLKTKKLYYAIAGAAVIFLMISGILIISNKLPLVIYQKVLILSRARLISFKNNSRLMSWHQGLRALASARALLGYGPENYYIAHNKHFDLKVSELRQGKSILDFDKAHNQPLENLVDLGIIGFLPYLGIFTTTGMSLWRDRKKKFRNSEIEKLILFLLFIAYFIHLLFTFDTPASYLLFFISLGMLYQTMTRSHKVTKSDTAAQQPNAVIGAIIITLTIISIPLMIYFINWRSYQASHKTAIAKAAEDKPMEVSFNFYYQALQYKPVQAFEVRRMMAADAISKIKEYKSQYKNLLLYVAQELEKNDKDDYYAQLMLGMVYNLLGSTDKRYYNQALRTLKHARALAPSRYQIYTELYGAYLGIGEYKYAKESVQKAMELGFKPKSAPQFIGLAFIFAQTGELKKSLDYYQKVIELDPKNVKVMGSIAALYKELGEKEKARDIVKKMLEIDPSLNEEVNIFLEQLEIN